jgi:hypothetical protein
MDRLGTTASKTLVSDVAIGILGALAAYFLRSSRERQEWRIREALGVVATSALSEERMARLQGIDEATDRIDDTLTDLSGMPF